MQTGPAPNSDPESEFFRLFKTHWDNGTGRPNRGDQRYGSWTTKDFLRELGRYGRNVTEDTPANWYRGKVLPNPETMPAILNVFFPVDEAREAGQPQANVANREELRSLYEGARATKAAARAARRKERAGPEIATAAGSPLPMPQHEGEPVPPPTSSPALATARHVETVAGRPQSVAGLQPSAKATAHPPGVANAGPALSRNAQPLALVLTALDLEATAVMQRLTSKGRDSVHGTWFEWGKFRRWTVIVVQVGPGNPPSAAVATRFLDTYQPRVAAFVGVAGGVKDVSIGDVVVATKVYAYESGKEDERGFRPRPVVHNTAHTLQSLARTVARNADHLQALSPELWPDCKPKAFVAPIAAGEAVVAFSEGRIAELLRGGYSDAVAVAMEEIGFLEAVHVHGSCQATVVRGISDLLSGKADAEKANSQPRAADAAAAFFFTMLEVMSPDTDKPQEEDNWKAERASRLRSEILKRLRSSPKVMAALETTAPAEANITMSSQLLTEDRPTQILDAIIGLKPFTDALEWLLKAYRDLPQHVDEGRDKLAEICAMLIPWLYVDDRRTDLIALDSAEFGQVLQLPIGVRSLAEIISAGLERRAAEYKREGEHWRGKASVGDPPPNGPPGDIEEQLRNELLIKLGISPEIAAGSPEKKDERINDWLRERRQYDNHGYYFTYIGSEFDQQQRMRGIAGRYPLLAVIELDRAWVSEHDSLWLRISRLLGLRT